jgi:hypothetical protein
MRRSWRYFLFASVSLTTSTIALNTPGAIGFLCLASFGKWYGRPDSYLEFAVTRELRQVLTAANALCRYANNVCAAHVFAVTAGFGSTLLNALAALAPATVSMPMSMILAFAVRSPCV